MVTDPDYDGSHRASDDERDSLHILPLSMIPLTTPGLARARLVKNSRLDGVVEVFQIEDSGRALLQPDQLESYFNWPSDVEHDDGPTIQRLAQLNSYDVYSLRIELRRLGIDVRDVGALKLSDGKVDELSTYMREFSGPLLRRIYGESQTEVADFDGLVEMFQRPNQEEALENLRKMAESLNIEILEVPQFLEDYADIFLSLAYFRDYLDKTAPLIGQFNMELKGLLNTHQLKNDHRFRKTCQYLETTFNDILTTLTGRIESFSANSKDMWRDITPESFRRVRDFIANNHTTIGGVLCGLSVKMQAWDERFGGMAEGANAMSRADFVTGDIRQGIERIAAIEASAPPIKDVA